MTEETAVCRGCKKVLRGAPYHLSKTGRAYDPDTGKAAKINYFGGFVCSRSCDYRSSLELESSMPGHMGQTSLSHGTTAHRKVIANWDEQS